MSGRFIICEKTGEWVMALRWATGNLPLRIYETRSLPEIDQELGRFPASFLVLEATTDNLEGVVRLLANVRQSYVLAQAVVLAQRSLGRWEDVLREAGARHVAFSPRRLDSIARLAYCHLAAMMQPELSVRDLVRLRMPWRSQ
jgi:hypothetical protein